MRYLSAHLPAPRAREKKEVMKLLHTGVCRGKWNTIEFLGAQEIRAGNAGVPAGVACSLSITRIKAFLSLLLCLA